MTHQEFVDHHALGLVDIEVDEARAVELLATQAVPLGQRLITWTWGVLCVACFPGALLCWALKVWWASLVLVAAGVAIPLALRRSATDRLIARALEDPVFYELAQQLYVMQVNERTEPARVSTGR